MISWTQGNCKKTKLNDNVCSRRPVTKTELSRAMLTMLIRSAPSGVASERVFHPLSVSCARIVPCTIRAGPHLLLRSVWEELD